MPDPVMNAHIVPGAVVRCADLAVLLASDEAMYITGAELNIDGGLLAGSSSPPRR